MTDHIQFIDQRLVLLDQRLLPRAREHVVCSSPEQVAAAIRDMVVRGAPAIGITAAYGMALAALHTREIGALEAAGRTLCAARPTAVNLAWAVEAMLALAREGRAGEILDAARRLHEEDIAINRSLGDSGARWLAQRFPERQLRLYTHCNAGALATGGYGTALGIVRSVAAEGRLERVYAGETRPYLQGARLTAWECEQDHLPCTLVTDSMAATLMSAGRVDAVVVGADRVARNGDVANKVGTLGLAVLARHYGLPFIVAVPCSTLDLATSSGEQIPIEERPADEVRGFGGNLWAADVDVFNPAFDVTPASLVSAWITERGPWTPAST